MQIGMTTGVRAPRQQSPVARAIGILKKFGSNAHIYQPGVGGSYGPTNLLLWSNDLTNAAYTLISSATRTTNSVTFAIGATSGIENLTAISGGTASKTFTVAALVSCASGTVPFRLKNTHGGVLDNFVELVATTTPTLYVLSVTNGASAGSGSQLFGVVNSATSPAINTLTVNGCGLFVGSYTASSLLALGGIPLTTTTSAAIYNAATVSGIQPYNYAASTGAANPDAVVDSTVGLMLDNGSTPGQLGAELAIQSTPDFTVAWFTKISSTITGTQQINLPTAGTSEVLEAPHGIQTANQTFLVTMTATGTGTVSFGVTNGVDLAVRTSVTLPGTFSFFAKMNSTNSSNGGFSIQRAVGDTATAVTVTAYSWKACYGIPASQSTAGSRPTLRRGAVNNALWSNDATNAAWTKSGTATASNATTVNLPAVSDVFSQSVTSSTLAAQGASVTAGFVLSGTGTVSISLSNLGGSFENQVVQVTLTSTPTLYVVSKTWANTLHTAAVMNLYRASGADTATTVTFGGGGLFLGSLSSATILQNGGIPLTTTTAASQSAGAWWGQYGSKILTLPSPAWTSADDHFTVAAVFMASNASYECVISLAGNSGASSTVQVGAIWKTNTNRFYGSWKNDAATENTIVDSVDKSGVWTIVSVVGRSTTGILRINGTQIGTTPRPTGATTINGASVGGYPSAGGYFSGNIGQIIAGKGTVSDTDLLTLERALGQQYGITTA